MKPPRIFRHLLAAMAATYFLAMPIHACLNDMTTKQAETEFRSSYEGQPAEKPVPRVIKPWAVAALASSGGIMAGVVAVRHKRKMA